MTNSFSLFLSDSSFTVAGNYELARCYFNAFHNQRGRYKHLNLKVVIGSLGLAGHFEFGGKYHTKDDFYKNPFDSHAWLEDAEGNVYDYIFPFYKECAILWHKNPTFPVDWEIIGCSKKDLEEEGLEYIPASSKARADIIKNVVAWAKTNRLDPWIVKGIQNM